MLLWAVLCWSVCSVVTLTSLPPPFTPHKLRHSSMLDEVFNVSQCSTTDGSYIIWKLEIFQFLLQVFVFFFVMVVKVKLGRIMTTSRPSKYQCCFLYKINPNTKVIKSWMLMQNYMSLSSCWNVSSWTKVVNHVKIHLMMHLFSRHEKMCFLSHKSTCMALQSSQSSDSETLGYTWLTTFTCPLIFNCYCKYDNIVNLIWVM